MKEHNGELDIMRSDLADGAIWWAVRHNENMVTERWPLTENSIRQLEKMRAANLREIERSTADDAQLPEGGIRMSDRHDEFCTGDALKGGQ